MMLTSYTDMIPLIQFLANNLRKPAELAQVFEPLPLCVGDMDEVIDS